MSSLTFYLRTTVKSPVTRAGASTRQTKYLPSAANNTNFVGERVTMGTDHICQLRFNKIDTFRFFFIIENFAIHGRRSDSLTVCQRHQIPCTGPVSSYGSLTIMGIFTKRVRLVLGC